MSRSSLVIGSILLAAYQQHERCPASLYSPTTNSERQVSRQRALFAAPGAARADWDIVADVGRRLGHSAAFDFANAAQVYREYAAMTALAGRHGKVLDLTAHAELDDAGYDALEPFRWGGRFPLAARYSTPDGKARMLAVAAPARQEDAEFPLRLNTGRYRDQWHTMTRTGLSPTLSQHRREPLLEVHPADAARVGVAEGGLARVVTRSGTSLFRVQVTDNQREGDVFVPMHWTDTMASEGRGNRLPGQGVDPVSGQPGFKNSAARIEPFVPEWRAFVVSADAVEPVGAWWVRSRIKGGWLYELAGEGAIDAEALLPEGKWIEALDEVRGMRRIAVLDDGGALRAALYLTRSGQLPPRDWAGEQLGQDAASAIELLAGRPSQPAPDRGPIVCVCHGIGANQIIAAATDGAATVEAIGEKTCAGTNCGSCRPAIARLLEPFFLTPKEAVA